MSKIVDKIKTKVENRKAEKEFFDKLSNKEWLLDNSEEVEFDLETVAAWNKADEKDMEIKLSLESFPQVCLEGLSEFGKEKILQKPLEKMIDKGLVELTVIDCENNSKLWGNFNEKATVLPFKKSTEIIGNELMVENNSEEIIEKIEQIVNDARKQFKREDNFWTSPITRDEPLKILVIDECQTLMNRNHFKQKEGEYIFDLVESFYILRNAGYMVILTTQKITPEIKSTIHRGGGLGLFFEEDKKESETVILGRKRYDVLSIVNVPDHLKGKLYKRRIRLEPDDMNEQKEQVVKFVYQNE